MLFNLIVTLYAAALMILFIHNISPSMRFSTAKLTSYITSGFSNWTRAAEVYAIIKFPLSRGNSFVNLAGAKGIPHQSAKASII